MFKYAVLFVIAFGTYKVVEQQNTIQTLSNNMLYYKNSSMPEIGELTLQRDRQAVKYSKKDLECLARNIFFEAGTENVFGKYAVAQVTINRAKHGYWGKTICQVVYAKDQFSWTNEAGLKDSKLEGPNWYESVAAAKAVLQQGMRIKSLKNALFYHADYTNPSWRDDDKMIGKLGHHIFYSGGKNSWVSL